MLQGESITWAESVCEDSQTDRVKFASAAISTSVYTTAEVILEIYSSQLLVIQLYEVLDCWNTNWQFNIIATDIQFQLSNLLVMASKMLILHYNVYLELFGWCLLNILLLCCAWIPPTQQVGAYYWWLGTQTALVQPVAPVASETGSCRAPQTPMLWCQINLDYTATHHQTVAVMVSYDSILCELCGDSLQRVFHWT